MVNMLNNTNRKYYYFLIRSNTRLMILYGLALFVSFPILCLSLFTTASIEGLYYTGKVLNLVLLLAATIFIPLILFKYTTEKSSLDVYHSLPIKKESLFGIHYAAGLLLLLLPFTLSWFSGIVISYLVGFETLILRMEIVRYFQLLLGVFVCFNLTVFVKKNCGTIFDSFLYTITLHLIPILAYTAVYGYLYVTLYGFNEPFSSEISFYLTPVMSIFIYGLMPETRVPMPVPNGVMVFQIILSVILFIAASHLYQKLKSEKTNIPFVNRYFYPIVSSIATLIAIILIHVIMNSIFSYTGIQTFIFPIFVGGTFYLLLDVIANRGFKHFTKALLQLAVLCVVTLAILLPVKYTKGLGYVTRVPDAEQVESITLTINYPYYFGDSSNASAPTFTDPEIIKTIVEIHQKIVDEASKYGYDRQSVDRNMYSEYSEYPDTTWFAVEYDLGLTKQKRQYSVPIEWMRPFSYLLGLDEMDQALYPMLYHSKEYQINQLHVTDLLDSANLFLNEKHDALFEALTADLKKETSAAAQDPANKVVGYLAFQYYRQDKYGSYSPRDIRIPIKENYKTTLAYLEGKNIQIPAADLSLLENKTYYLIFPNTDEKRDFFYSSDDNSRFGRMRSVYDFSYKSVSFDEFKALAPYLHRTNGMKEANIVLLVMNENKEEYETYFISYKDLELVNTIVTSEMQQQQNGIYNLITYN